MNTNLSLDSPFVIVGAGGMGRELLGWIATGSPAQQERYRVAAFIAESEDTASVCHGIPVVSPQSYRGPKPRYVIAIADPGAKKRISATLDGMGWHAEVFIHEMAIVGLAASIGAGTIICPHCRISSDCAIGAHVLVNCASGVAHDVVLGDYATLLGSVSLNGGVTVGEGALFGAGSMVYPGKKIGAWAKVGLGSVVLRSVPDHATVFGNPAQRI
ncbi:MAG TPA: NeuD/PglB/VioB family sugar acetyltransferase [Noviherbaspirillum sp.]